MRRICLLIRASTQKRFVGRLRSQHGLALAGLLFAVIGLGGCGMGTTELPANTQPGGPGFLSIITPQLEDGVAGLSYTSTINTTGGSGVLASCIVVSGNLPSGFIPAAAQGSECFLTTNGQPVTGAPGKYTFTLEAGDTSTPQRTDQRVYSLTIRPHFTITAPIIPDAVAGRSYTRTFTVATDLQNHSRAPVIGSSESGNGPIRACSVSGLPSPFTAGGGAASCSIASLGVSVVITMNAPAGSLSGGPFPFSLSITDTAIAAPNQSTVVVPQETETISSTLTVRQEFSVTQASLADAVQGRTYGVAPLAQPEQTSAVAAAPASPSGQSTELGNGPLTQCTLIVSPADAALSVSIDPANRSRCLLESSSPVAAAGAYTVTVNATDSPILDPASPTQVVVPANTMSRTLTWTVDAPISYTATFDSPAGQPGVLSDAVEGRTYGAPAKSSVVIAASGGLSSETGASIVQGGTLPAGVVCANQPPNPVPELICSSSGQAVGAPLGTTNITVTASDPGNLATPPDSSSTDVNGHTSHSILVDAPLALAPNFASPLPAAVQLRSYGAAPSTPVTYTASGGLSGYQFSTATGEATPANGFPSGMTCSQGTGAGLNVFSCGTLPGATIAAAFSSTPYTPIVTLDDTANPTTPDGASSGTGASQASSLTVNMPLTITASGSAAVAPPPGVSGRTYGTGSGFSPLIYTVTGGDPPYTITPIDALTAPASNGVPAPTACVISTASNQTGTAVANNQLTCESASGITAATGTYPFIVNVVDSGSAGVAAAPASLAESVIVNAAMTLTPQSTSPPLAVSGRTYGDPNVTCAGSACAPLIYNINGGLGGYSASATPSGFPGTFTCPFTSTGALSGTYACSTAAAVAGTSPAIISVTASDTANTATPAATLAANNVDLSIAAPLSLTLTSGAPLPAVSGRAYGTGPGCSGGSCQPVVYGISGGTGIYPATAAMSTTAGPFACSLSGANYDCSSAAITLASGTAALDISLSDTANASTPNASVANNTASVTVNAAMSISGPSGTLAAAVDNRTYGDSLVTCGSSGCAPIVYTITGGLGGYSSTPTLNGYTAGFQCAFSSTGSLSGTYTCSNPSSVTGSPSITIGITASDTANASTPTLAATSNTASLPINPPLQLTPPTPVLPAVNGRAYGQGTGCAPSTNCQTINFAVSGGTGVYVTPPSITSAAATFACPLSGSAYTCSTPAITASSGTLSLTASDVANTSTPGGTSSPSSITLAINPAMTLTGPSGTLAAAVAGRTYGGTGNNCGSSGTSACAAIAYSINNGLGGYSNPPTLNNYPGSFACSFTSGGALSGTYGCNSLTGVTGSGTTSVSITASDTANASTPSQTINSSTSASLTVNPEINLTASPTSPWPEGVIGRHYGDGTQTCSSGPCAPITVSVTGGLGPSYVYPSLTPSSFPTGFGCTPSGLSSLTSYTCDATANLSGAVQTYTPIVPVGDQANASTPENTVNLQGSLPVASALDIQQTALTNALLDYAYSTSVTAQNGLGSYAWVLPGGTATRACTVPTGTAPTGLSTSGLNASPLTLSGPFTTPASTVDPDFTFAICLTDTANVATPAGSALPNPPTNAYTTNVFNRYAFIVDTGATKEVRVIKTGDHISAPSNPGTTVAVTGPGTGSGDVAVTPDGNYTFVLLPAANSFDVIDTITNTLVATTSFPSGFACASPVGVAFSSDSTKAYFACGGSPAGVVELNISNVAAPVGVATATPTAAPTAIALSPDGTNVYATIPGPDLLIYSASLASSTSASLTTGFTPGAVLATASAAYVAETKSAAPGRVDIVSISGGTGTLSSSILFTSSTVSATTYNPAPSCLAITPDGARVYVGLQGTDAFAVIQTSSNTQLTGSPFLLPTAAPGSSTTIGTSSPDGVTIPSLFAVPSAGYRVFFSSINSGNGEVDIIDDNKGGAPAPDTTTLTNFSSTSTPQGIAAIPVPQIQ